MKKLLVLIALMFSVFSIGFNYTNADGIFNNNETKIKYGDGDFSLQKGIESVKGVDDIKTEGKASDFIQNIVSYTLSFLGIFAVIMIIYAGFNLLTSGGDDDKASTSKKIIMFAVFGLVIIFLAGPIIDWVIGILNSASSTSK